MELSPGKTRAQLKSLDQAARQVLAGLFGRHLPADLTLGDFYRSNRYCGSRDRGVISAGVYALLRYWGWVRRLLPQDRLNDVEAGHIRLTAAELGALIGAGVFFENSADPLLKLLEQLYSFPLPKVGAAEPERRAGQLADMWGCPHHFSAVELVPGWMQQECGSAYCEQLKSRPALWLRVASHAADVHSELRENGVDFELFPEYPELLKLNHAKANFRSYKTFQSGYFEIQDRASQGIGWVTGAQQGERWLDACAGAGGKTLQLAALMQGRGTIVAGDVRERALTELKLRARRAGFSNVQTRLHDGKLWRGFSLCDGVLLDAPCSGSGVWRRNPGAMWTLSETALSDYVARQAAILDEFCAAVKPGGVLIYSTCSIFTAENEQQIQNFVSRHPEFKLENFKHPWSNEECSGEVRLTGEACDSMFAARLRRTK